MLKILKISKALFVCFFLLSITVQARETYNFNSGWVIEGTKHVTLPHAWNEDEAFRVPIASMTGKEIWYRKHFRLPKTAKGQRVFIEFEGARMAAEVFLNGKSVGLSENGIMAFGFELTPYLKDGDNFIEVKTDNSWDYKEITSGSTYQWNDKNFNCNFGGLQKNVKLHIVPQVYQTLPLYSNLKTTGQYIYATDFDIAKHKATVHAETEVCNSSDKDVTVNYSVVLKEYDGKVLVKISGGKTSIPAGESKILKTQKRLSNLHFWSWGYGYLYKVETIVSFGKETDRVETVTGFRKTEFTNGYLRLNDRAMMIHGYAQRSSNEWPGVGISVPAWLSDYSNHLQVESGGNLVRWMHITPWKQDVESCDRVGLLQAMPAGDAEKDVDDRRWEHRLDVMRDAIIYNRNNPSVVFIECGNQKITAEHMLQMKAIRDQYDPNGGRAIGCREMLDRPEAEYGGEMLYVNKSDTKPMWMMEYCRDEGMRNYWNAWTYPYHGEGAGPLYRNTPALTYNHNMDEFAAEMVHRWYEYWQERPGQGTMVNDGGVKIVFSDTQTHGRSEANYRLSGVVDAMRIPKDAFYAHQVMWSGWVDDIKPATYIVGHWTYDDEDERLGHQGRKGLTFTVPMVYVVSTADSVALFCNDKPMDIKAHHSDRFLFTFKNIPYAPGTLTAIGYDSDGKEQSRHSIETAGKAVALKLTAIENPAGWRADGADVALVQVEAIDVKGRRSPIDFSLVDFTLEGEAEWRGGVAKGEDNYVLSKSLPVECGVNRVMLRSTTKAGRIKLIASSKKLGSATIELETKPFEDLDGLSKTMPSDGLALNLEKGETPLTPSFVQHKVDAEIVKVEAGSNGETARYVIDKIENTQWNSSGKDGENWVALFLAEPQIINEIAIKMRDHRTMVYPIAVYADETEVFRGKTHTTLGYIRLPLVPVKASKITIRSLGRMTSDAKFGEVKELDSSNDEKAQRASNRLAIAELQLIK